MSEEIYRKKVNELYELIKTQKNIDLNNQKLFCDIIEKIAENELGISDYKIEYEKLGKNIGGMSYENKATINSEYVKALSLANFTNSIFHELRHIYQNKFCSYNKGLNQARKNNFIANYLPAEIDSYITLNQKEISYFNLYFVSDIEVDARDFAFKMTNKLFLDLKNLAKKDKKCSKLTKLFIDIEFYLNQKQRKKENKLYNKSLLTINENYNSVKQDFYYQLKCLLDSYDHNHRISIDDYRKIESSTVTNIRVLTWIYCDKEMERVILDKVKRENDPFLFSALINSPFVKINEKTLRKCFDMFIQCKYAFNEISNCFYNWDEKLLLDIWNKNIDEKNNIK